MSEHSDWQHLPIARRWGLLEPQVSQVIVTLGWNTIDVTKSICWKVQRHSLRDTCHSRTVLSMEDDKIKWFWSKNILHNTIIYLKVSIVKVLSTWTVKNNYCYTYIALPEFLNSPPVFSGVRVTRSLVLICMFCSSLFVLLYFSFGHCVVCSYLIHWFCLTLWYLQTFLISPWASIKPPVPPPPPSPSMLTC